MDILNDYLLHTLNEDADWIQELEKYAKDNKVPIMEPVSMNFLTQLVRLKQPKNVLEIGSAIGYSALRMIEVSPNSQLTTIEKSAEMYEQACKNIKQYDTLNQVNIIHGDAIEALESLYDQQIQFDFIFIDAAKGKYKSFFELVQPLVADQAVIVCDNILFKGYVADPLKEDNKRLQKLANKIRDFNTWLMEQEAYHTSIVPIGDGLTVSIKR